MKIEIPAEVHELVQKLKEIKEVAEVTAIPKLENVHWIDFELGMHPETELDDEIWDKIQDLIIDCEWGLRDKTNEEWHFPRKAVVKNND